MDRRNGQPSNRPYNYPYPNRDYGYGEYPQYSYYGQQPRGGYYPPPHHHNHGGNSRYHQYVPQYNQRGRYSRPERGRREYFRNKNLPLCKCGRRCRISQSQKHQNKYYYSCFQNRCDFSIWEDEYVKDENRVNVESNKEIYYLLSNRRCSKYEQSLEKFLRINILKVLKKRGDVSKDMEDLHCTEVNEMFLRFRNIYTDFRLKDDQIYQQLREALYPDETPSSKEESEQKKDVVCNFIGGKEKSSRGEFRMNNILDVLPKGFKASSVLDYGCGDGSITTTIGEHFGVEKEHLFGVDVIPQKPKQRKEEEEEDEEGKEQHQESANSLDKIKYLVIDSEKENCKLDKIEDGSIELVTALMSFHHVKHLESTLEEIHRIVDPTRGVIVIREHDWENSDFGIYLDIVHGMYALVFSDPIENKDWRKNYFAKFYSQSEWKRILQKKKFMFLNVPKAYGLYRSFYLALIPDNEKHIYYSLCKKTGLRRGRESDDLYEDDRRKRRKVE